MVVKVVGTIDGRDVIFNQNQATGRWETIIPPDLDGTYVVDLWAYDEAGNRGYAATVLFTVDVERLHFCVELLKYKLKLATGKITLLAVNTKLQLVNAGIDYTMKPITTKYNLERGHDCALQ